MGDSSFEVMVDPGLTLRGSELRALPAATYRGRIRDRDVRRNTDLSGLCLVDCSASASCGVI
jgi:hypothetical protein